MKRKIISPVSILRAKKLLNGISPWNDKIGRLCRVGYYSRQDGIDVVWLVDEDGDYCETTDQKDLESYFDIVVNSNIQDTYGDLSDTLPPIFNPSIEWKWSD